jgi:ribosomal protein S27AE
MNRQTDPKVTCGCLTTLVIMMLVVTYVTTSSLNPLAVYSSDSIFGKIVVSLFALLIGVSVLQLLTNRLMRSYIRMMTGKPADDAICPGCGFPLLQFVSSHGQPITCPKCHKVWHNGPACYSKGLDQKYTVIPSIFCPRCRLAASQSEDLYGDVDDILK